MSSGTWRGQMSDPFSHDDDYNEDGSDPLDFTVDDGEDNWMDFGDNE